MRQTEQYLVNNKLDHLINQVKEIQKRLDFFPLLTKDILDVEEACEYLNISKSTLYKISANRIIPFSKPNGKKIYFRKESLDNWKLSKCRSSEKCISQNASEWVKHNIKL